MSIQILELLIFAGITFLIVIKLISQLGSTFDDDFEKGDFSFFGESSVKDVTNTSDNSNFFIRKFFFNKNSVNNLNIDNFIILNNKDSIKLGLKFILLRIPYFNIAVFLDSAKIAFKMIIDSANSNNLIELDRLVDKRYIMYFTNIVTRYGSFILSNKLEAKVSEIYIFANDVFIKVIFSGNNITTNIKVLHEEWTFSKSLLSSDINWFLTNVDLID